jgi:hypothetical protein
MRSLLITVLLAGLLSGLLAIAGCMTTNNVMYVYDNDNCTITQTVNQNKPVTPSTTLSIPASLLGL